MEILKTKRLEAGCKCLKLFTVSHHICDIEFTKSTGVTALPNLPCTWSLYSALLPHSLSLVHAEWAGERIPMLLSHLMKSCKFPREWSLSFNPPYVYLPFMKCKEYRSSVHWGTSVRDHQGHSFLSSWSGFVCNLTDFPFLHIACLLLLLPFPEIFFLFLLFQILNPSS